MPIELVSVTVATYVPLGAFAPAEVSPSQLSESAPAGRLAVEREATWVPLGAVIARAAEAGRET